MKRLRFDHAYPLVTFGQDFMQIETVHPGLFNRMSTAKGSESIAGKTGDVDKQIAAPSRLDGNLITPGVLLSSITIVRVHERLQSSENSLLAPTWQATGHGRF